MVVVGALGRGQVYGPPSGFDQRPRWDAASAAMSDARMEPRRCEVGPVGVEPTRLAAADFKSAASASFATGPVLRWMLPQGIGQARVGGSSGRAACATSIPTSRAMIAAR